MHPKIVAALVLAAAGAVLSGCSARAQPTAPDAPVAGDSRRGVTAIGHYGCGSCHTIAGVPGAHGLVGPPLTGVGSRLYIAGMLENTPENLSEWIQHPRSVNEKTVMPEMGVTPEEAADITAYLSLLK